MAETFDCSKCIERGLNKIRPCGLSESLLRRFGQEPEQSPSETSKKQQKQFERMKNPRSKRNRKIRENQSKGTDVKRKLYITKHFVCKECPVSYVPPLINDLSDMVYICENTALEFYSGSVFDLPKKLYDLYRTAVSENSKIEREEFEDKTKD